MLASQIPTKFPIAFGTNAAAGTIRPIPQASQPAGAASLNDGFPTITGQPLASGGIPPSMQDFNGLLNQITAWNRWQNAGGTVAFDATFSAAVGGYPAGAILASTSAGTLWLSTVDNNTTNPDSPSAANWLPIVTGIISIPASTSTSQFTLSAAQSIPNNATTQLTMSGTSPTWGAFANSTLTINKSGIYTITLLGSMTITPSQTTTHANIFFIYINNGQSSQQTAVNYTGAVQSIGLSQSYTSFFPANTTVSWYAYGGNSGTTDTVSVGSATATVTKMA